MSIRVRFAPSPTGYLHIGGARTALFNFLYARHTGGVFLLRVEDTDRERSTEASRASILEALDWLGITPDEPVVIQSARFEEHIATANRLLAEGRAYRCWCDEAELDAMREKALAEGRKPRYDGRCRHRSDAPTDRPYTVRFAIPETGATTVDDLVLGSITVQNDELDDLIILRSDGTPTYNFVVVCDDAYMRVTHVIRGQDHMTNTFRQVHIYRALGCDAPRFGHLPLVDGLSKRKGSASVQAYRDAGFVAEAVANYIARLGWSHGDQEIFSRDELIALFDVADVNRGSGKFDEQKMAWVNATWLKRLDASDLAARLLPFLVRMGIETAVDDRLVGLVRALQERSNTLVEMAAGAAFAWKRPESHDADAVKKWMKSASRPAFEQAIARLRTLDPWTPSHIDAVMNEIARESGLGLGKLAQPIRIALTGSSVSPPIFDTIAAVGREECVARMQTALPLFAGA